MFGISGFFKNIQNAFTKEVLLRMSIKEAIKKHVGVEIKIEDIACKNGIITIKQANSSLLSTIFIKKTKILAELNSNNVKVTDIR